MQKHLIFWPLHIWTLSPHICVNYCTKPNRQFHLFFYSYMFASDLISCGGRKKVLLPWLFNATMRQRWRAQREFGIVYQSEHVILYFVNYLCHDHKMTQETTKAITCRWMTWRTNQSRVLKSSQFCFRSSVQWLDVTFYFFLFAKKKVHACNPKLSFLHLLVYRWNKWNTTHQFAHFWTEPGCFPLLPLFMLR